MQVRGETRSCELVMLLRMLVNVRERTPDCWVDVRFLPSLDFAQNLSVLQRGFRYARMDWLDWLLIQHFPHCLLSFERQLFVNFSLDKAYFLGCSNHRFDNVGEKSRLSSTFNKHSFDDPDDNIEHNQMLDNPPTLAMNKSNNLVFVELPYRELCYFMGFLS